MQVNVCTENYIQEDKGKKTCVVNLAPTKVDQCIEQLIEREGFVNFKIDKQFVSTKNSNYLGVLYAIDVKGKTKNGDKEINLFVKNIKPKEDLPEIISISEIYKTELFAYKELFKIYEELQEEANVPLEKRFQTVKFYEESDKEVIIMENLAKKGFTTCHRMHTMSLQYAKLSVQALAKFHGLSFVLKAKRPDYYEAKIKPLKYPFIFNENWPLFIDKMKNITMNFIDERLKNKVEKVYSDYVDNFPQYYKDESTKICLCHGDYTPNNILIKSKNGEILEAVPVDYQLMYYGCPVSDFIYFIYFCTDREFRKAHMLDLKNLYYEELGDFLKYFDLDTETVYPRKEFERNYKDKLEFGLMNSLLYLAFMFVSEDIEPDVIGLNLQIDVRFRERLNGVLEDYEEWGYL